MQHLYAVDTATWYKSDEHTLKVLYFTLVQSNLDYCSTVWLPFFEARQHKIEWVLVLITMFALWEGNGWKCRIQKMQKKKAETQNAEKKCRKAKCRKAKCRNFFSLFIIVVYVGKISIAQNHM